jgi:hypothetical protein
MTRSFFASTILNGLLLLPLVWVSGCRALPVSLVSNRLPQVDVTLQATPTSTPGLYQLSGQANFPDQTEINILAIRPLAALPKALEPSEPSTSASADTPEPPKLTYSVLAYQVVSIENEQWQSQLNLWQTATDGRMLETWQLDQSELNLNVQPLDSVIFIATFTPFDQLTTLEGILYQQGLRLSSALIRTTAEGQRYLQASQVVEIPLPKESSQSLASQALAERPQPHNGGWGTRYLLIEEPPLPYQLDFPEERQTDAPGTAEELLY